MSDESKEEERFGKKVKKYFSDRTKAKKQIGGWNMDIRGKVRDMEDSPTYAGAGRGGGGSFIKSFIIFVIVVFILLLLFTYGYAYYETGKIEKIWVESGVFGKTKGFFEDLFIYGPQRASVYGTKTSEDKEDHGIKFKDFKALTPYVLSGSQASFAFILEPSDDIENVPVELNCGVSDESVVDGDIEVDDDVIYASKPTTYKNLGCYFDTNELREDKTIYVEGNVTFPYKTEDVKLDVYFISMEVYDKSGETFFDDLGIEEDSVIKVEYKGEPIEVGIGTSLDGESIQPVIVGKDFDKTIVAISLSSRWDGRVENINNFELYIPSFLRINKEKSELSMVCPFDDGKEENGYFVYKAEEDVLNLLKSFGRGEKENYIKFYCFLKPEGDLNWRSHKKSKYMVNVGYDYELPSKKAVLKLLKKETSSVGEGTQFDEEETPSDENEEST